VAPWGLRSQTKIPGGVFTHIAVTFGAGRSKIYVNGTLRGSQVSCRCWCCRRRDEV